MQNNYLTKVFCSSSILRILSFGGILPSMLCKQFCNQFCDVLSDSENYFIENSTMNSIVITRYPNMIDQTLIKILNYITATVKFHHMFVSCENVYFSLFQSYCATIARCKHKFLVTVCTLLERCKLCLRSGWSEAGINTIQLYGHFRLP